MLLAYLSQKYLTTYTTEVPICANNPLKNDLCGHVC